VLAAIAGTSQNQLRYKIDEISHYVNKSCSDLLALKEKATPLPHIVGCCSEIYIQYILDITSYDLK
jgi:hypothetical protein